MAVRPGTTASCQQDRRPAAGGLFRVAYVHPPKMRSTRDLLRRRMFLTRRRAALITHVKCTFARDNHPEHDKCLVLTGTS